MKYGWIICGLISLFASIGFTAPEVGAVVYQQYCAGCHETGTANAPRRTDTQFWQKREQQVPDTAGLVNTVIQGKNGMPPMGGCTTCTEVQLREAVNYLLQEARSGSRNSTQAQLPLEKLILPPGFSIQVYAQNLPGARTLAMSDSGVIFVGTRGQGKVYALIPAKNPDQPPRVLTLLSGLNEPHGIAYHQGDLYVAEINRISRYGGIDQHLEHPPAPTLIKDDLPTPKWHGYRVLHVGPDNQLYISIGMPCNTCNYRKKQPLFGTITRLSLDGKDMQPYAIGIRNSVGFTWHPSTKGLWFTDNGQDLLGDDVPADELNLATQAYQDFGFPYVYGDQVLAPGYSKQDIKSFLFQNPKANFQAHSAPLGLTFYTGTQFPRAYQNQLLVAFHGSWNRSKKVGYEVLMVNLEDNHVTEVKPFITGFLQGEKAWGRPVDLFVLKDGSVLITDDLNGVIYRVSYKQ